jgi:hypothetical protein
MWATSECVAAGAGGLGVGLGVGGGGYRPIHSPPSPQPCWPPCFALVTSLWGLPGSGHGCEVPARAASPLLRFARQLNLFPRLLPALPPSPSLPCTPSPLPSRVPVCTQVAVELMGLADHNGIDGLKILCESTLIHNVEVSNVCTFFRTAHRHEVRAVRPFSPVSVCGARTPPDSPVASPPSPQRF